MKLRPRIKPKIKSAKAMTGTLIRKYFPLFTQGELTLFSGARERLCIVKTIELPNKNNKPRESCIPEGIYSVILVSRSNKINYPHFHILDVPNRDGIKIHKGNYTSQILGCILPGLHHVDMNKDGIMDVSNSGEALHLLIDVANMQGITVENKQDFKLTIKSNDL